MKQGLKGVAPPALLDQRKRGFAIPVHRWFRGRAGEMFEELVLGRSARCGEYFDAAAVRGIYDAHRTGRRDAGHQLWAILMFEQWLRYAATLPGVSVTL